jgi:hypothetical protein
LHIVRKHKRNKALMALLFPIVIVLFLIGWSLSWIGFQKQPRKTPIETGKDNVHMGAMVLEELPEIAE